MPVDSLPVFTHFLSLSIWIGSLLFLLSVVMPALAGMLADELADAVSRQLLRAYHAIAGACAFGAVGSLLLLARVSSVPHAVPRLSLLLVMSMMTGVVGWIVQPRIDALRQAMPDYDPQGSVTEQAQRLARLQRTAVQVDGLVLLLGLLNLWLSLGGPAL